MEVPKTYVRIIEDFIRRNGPANLAEIYKEVKNERKNLPKWWKSIVRNKLYFTNHFQKFEGKWRFIR